MRPQYGSFGDVDYVLVSGERRHRGATAVGLPVLDCVVNDDFAKDRKTFLEAVVSENVDRQNFNPVEEAYAVQALVTEFGSNRAVAQHFDRVDGWVTQRILLTHLAREAQDLVRKKSMPLDAARALGKLARNNEWGSAEQTAWWQSEQERRATASADRSAAKKAAKKATAAKQLAPSKPPAEPEQYNSDAEEFYGRKTELGASAASESHSTPKEPATVDQAPVPTSTATEAGPPVNGSGEATPSLPAQATAAEATASAEGQQPRRFPYEDGAYAAQHLIHKMPADEFNKMLDLLIKHRDSQTVPAS
ncbi:hypothetical protein [Streptomyces sp. NPDC005989]|uniref:ParB/RepB/Spo0J family partition protein n=1 Tax=Streptomyces sp. NPDC005989 TaxID=3156727 RepID=UPI0033D9A239